MKAHCVHKSQYTCFLTTRVTAELMGQKHNRPLVTLTRNLKQETDVFYKIYCKSHYSVNKL